MVIDDVVIEVVSHPHTIAALGPVGVAFLRQYGDPKVSQVFRGTLTDEEFMTLLVASNTISRKIAQLKNILMIKNLIFLSV